MHTIQDPRDGRPLPEDDPARLAAALRSALEQKTALLHEVDHRVNNNLQLIASLLLLQARQSADPQVRDALRAMMQRVSAIAAVHRRLLHTEDTRRLDLSGFVEDLVSELAGSLARPDVKVGLDLESIEVAAAEAAPLALIVNELVANSLQHAFPDDRPGAVAVSAAEIPGGYEVVVQDNGTGMPPTDRAPPGFGLTVVNLLCRQLGGECRIGDAQPGVRAVVRIAVKPARPS